MTNQVPYTPSNPTYPPPPLSPSDERTWAMVAHLSILLNVFTGFLGTVGALVIYLALRDRSPFVAYQSMQAFVFQLITWVIAGIVAVGLWAVAGVLTVVCIGVLLYPLALLVTLLPIAALVYAVVGAVQVNQGQDFHYWLIGDWVRSISVP